MYEREAAQGRGEDPFRCCWQELHDEREASHGVVGASGACKESERSSNLFALSMRCMHESRRNFNACLRDSQPYLEVEIGCGWIHRHYSNTIAAIPLHYSIVITSFLIPAFGKASNT